MLATCGPTRRRCVLPGLRGSLRGVSRLRVCTIVRSIAASDAPLHHIVVIHQQDNPYAASLLRRELDFTHILCSGVSYRSLRDTQTGLLLQELVDSAVELNVPRGAIEREQLIESITSTPIRWPSEQGEGEASTRSITVPGARGQYGPERPGLRHDSKGKAGPGGLDKSQAG